MRVLILYTELAGYVLSSISRFLKDNPSSDVLLIHYPVNPEAPFNLVFPPGSKAMVYSEAEALNIKREAIKFEPHIVLCSGWSNANYLEVIKHLPRHVKKVLCFDNKWKGQLRQWINVCISRFYLLRLFSFAWVPGNPQKVYALKLGFQSRRIFTGLYPADSELFSQTGIQKLSNRGKYPRILLCVARYIPQKDLPTLWRAFIAANSKSSVKWKLNCIGFGDEFDKRVIHPDINHLGFKQPSEMKPFILESGLYVLPSITEPWGVAVHEMALSALPLVLSDKIGSSDLFLRDDNGIKFKAGDADNLEKVLLSMMEKSDEALWDMAEKSFEYGMLLQSCHWSDTLQAIDTIH